MNDTVAAWAALTGMLILLVGMTLCANQRDNLKKEAVTRGFAIYNPTNGNWQWKESN